MLSLSLLLSSRISSSGLVFWMVLVGTIATDLPNSVQSQDDMGTHKL